MISFLYHLNNDIWHRSRHFRVSLTSYNFFAVSQGINVTLSHSQWLKKISVEPREGQKCETSLKQNDEVTRCESSSLSTDLLRRPADSVFQPLSRKPDFDLLLAELRLRRQAHDLRHRRVREPATGTTAVRIQQTKETAEVKIKTEFYCSLSVHVNKRNLLRQKCFFPLKYIFLREKFQGIYLFLLFFFNIEEKSSFFFWVELRNRLKKVFWRNFQDIFFFSWK